LKQAPTPKKEINVIDFTPPHRIVQKSVSQHRIIIERLTCTMAPQDEVRGPSWYPIVRLTLTVDQRCCGIDRARKIVAERREAEKERQREAKKMRKREMEKKRERERVEDSGRRVSVMLRWRRGLSNMLKFWKGRSD
jgi:hypothetical protein